MIYFRNKLEGAWRHSDRKCCIGKAYNLVSAFMESLVEIPCFPLSALCTHVVSCYFVSRI